MIHTYNIRQIVKVKAPDGEFRAMIMGFMPDGLSYLVKNIPGADEKWQRVIAEEWIIPPDGQRELIKKVRQAGL